MARVTVGVEVGHQRDPYAIAVVEAERRDDGHHFAVRHLERLAPAARFPEIAERLGEVVAGVHGKTGGERPQVYPGRWYAG